MSSFESQRDEPRFVININENANAQLASAIGIQVSSRKCFSDVLWLTGLIKPIRANMGKSVMSATCETGVAEFRTVATGGRASVVRRSRSILKQVRLVRSGDADHNPEVQCANFTMDRSTLQPRSLASHQERARVASHRVSHQHLSFPLRLRLSLHSRVPRRSGSGQRRQG